MEREFTNENMEEFLRRSADGLRMRPSGKVWKGITHHLNRRRRRIGLILGTSLLLTTALGYYLINESAKQVTNTTTNSDSRIEKRVSNEISAISKDNNNLVATNSNTIKKGNKLIEGHLAEIQPFSFVQNLLQHNEEAAQNAFNPTIVDSYFEEGLNKESNWTAQKATGAINPLSIESVLNSYQPKTRKLDWQMYLTPTISYRSLNNNNIDNYAPHKPAFGFELGVAAKYPVSKTVKFRAGLQFNVNRYEIKTYDSYTQQATIRLNDRNGVDVRTVTTNYNNTTGYKSKWLQNLYFQVSAPIGFEVKLKGDDKVQLGMASTLQPTYLLGDKAYLISWDYKNYAEVPNLVRRWNVNTSLETFVAYSTGHVNWQVGPQVRYQILSSYLKKYPVKENLFDFGLKLGLSFNKQ